MAAASVAAVPMDTGPVLAAEPSPAVGQVSGTVWSSDGTPLAGVSVRVGDRPATTGADGRYTVTDVEPGDHRAVFYGYEVGHESARLDGTPWKSSSMMFGDPPSNTDSDINVAVDPGESVSGINAVLRPNGSLSGVIDAAGDVDRSMLRVDAFQRIEAYGGWMRFEVAWVDAAGRYAFKDLPPGDYRVVVRARTGEGPDSGAALAHSGGAAGFETSSLVRVPPGEDVTGVRLAVDRTARLSGIFASEVDGPLADEPVRLRKWDGSEQEWFSVARTVTSAAGEYSFPDLTAGRYRITSDVPGRTYRPVLPTDIDVERGADEQVDAVLRRLTQVTGLVTDAVTGEPVPHVRVSPYVQDGSTWRPTYHGTTTDESGRYVLQYNGAVRLRLWFGSNSYAPEFNGDADTIGRAPTVEVPTAGTVIEDVVLSPGGSVTGTVTDRTGEPVLQASVAAYRLVDGVWVHHGSAPSSSPAYRIDHLVPGTYILRFSAPYDVATYSGGVSARTAASRLVVGDSGQVTWDQEIATSGNRVSGRVSFVQRDPATGEDEVVPGATVRPALYERIAGEWHRVMTGRPTEDDGTFEVIDAPPGTYRVGFEHVWGQYATEFWGGARTIEDARDLVVTGDVTEVDVTLELDPQRRIFGEHGNGAHISGDQEVGRPLTVSNGRWNRSDLTFTYWWSVNGTRVPGADQATFVPAPEHAGHRVHAHVTAHGVGSPPGYSGDDTIPIGQALSAGYTAQVAPDVAGDPVVGTPLQAAPGSWTPAGGTHAYQWLSGDRPVAGANGPTYVPSVDDIGKGISVRVLTWGNGVIPTASTSAPSAVVTAPAPPASHEHVVPGSAENAQVANLVRPRITGTPRVGRRLHARPGAWTPDDVTFRFRWYADGRRVEGATRAHLRLTPRMRGARLVVRVTARTPGADAVTVRSPRTRVVRPRRG